MTVAFLTGCFILALSTGAVASWTNKAVFWLSNNNYMVNDKIQSMDAAPFIENSRTYVPVRYLAYVCGLTDKDIKWNDVFETVTLTKGNTTLQLQVGIDQAIKNNLVQNLDAAPIMKSGRTYLPARWVAEAFGSNVQWDKNNQAVLIYH